MDSLGVINAYLCVRGHCNSLNPNVFFWDIHWWNDIRWRQDAVTVGLVGFVSPWQRVLSRPFSHKPTSQTKKLICATIFSVNNFSVTTWTCRASKSRRTQPPSLGLRPEWENVLLRDGALASALVPTEFQNIYSQMSQSVFVTLALLKCVLGLKFWNNRLGLGMLWILWKSFL